MCADHLLSRLLLHEVIHVEREALCSLLSAERIQEADYTVGTDILYKLQKSSTEGPFLNAMCKPFLAERTTTKIQIIDLGENSSWLISDGIQLLCSYCSGQVSSSYSTQNACLYLQK